MENKEVTRRAMTSYSDGGTDQWTQCKGGLCEIFEILLVDACGGGSGRWDSGL